MNHGEFSQKFRSVLIAIVVLTVGGAVAQFLLGIGYHEGYSPEQPIPFSHRLHAGNYKIPCMYCHVTAEKSRHASVPAMNVCLNCHSVVKGDSPHIQKMKALYEKGQAFQWVRVHDMPDHVYFPHNRHIARGVQCETCHGDVAKMERVYQATKMSMGWCLDCHRGQTTPDYLYKEGEKRGPVAPVNCNTCHY